MTHDNIIDRINKLDATWSEFKKINDGVYKKEEVTRVEVVDKNGRAYVNMSAKNVRLSYQDSGKTLKVFID